MGWLEALKYVVVGGGSLGALSLGLIYAFQEKMLYVPRIPGMSQYEEYLVPSRFGFDAEDVWLTAADGTRLHAWLLKPQGWTGEQLRRAPLLVFFQENAGNMSHRLPFLRAVSRHLGVPIFAPSYRGYGMSEGRPNQRGLMLDAQAVLDHVLARDDVNNDAIVLFGRSLGGAVALHLAAENEDKIKGLIVENTFLSVEDMVPQVLPPLGAVIGAGKPLNCLVTNKWRNLPEIQRITRLPLLMMASVHDEMVPFRHMQALHAAAATPHAVWVEFPRALHMDAYDRDPERYWPALTSFFRTYVLPRPGEAAAAAAMEREAALRQGQGQQQEEATLRRRQQPKEEDSSQHSSQTSGARM